MNTSTGFGLATSAALVAISAVAVVTPISQAQAAGGKVVHCYGVNTCKGTSDCKSGAHECKGQNECKGQGFKALTTKACTAQGGSLTEKK